MLWLKNLEGKRSSASAETKDIEVEEWIARTFWSSKSDYLLFASQGDQTVLHSHTHIGGCPYVRQLFQAGQCYVFTLHNLLKLHGIWRVIDYYVCCKPGANPIIFKCRNHSTWRNSSLQSLGPFQHVNEPEQNFEAESINNSCQLNEIHWVGWTNHAELIKQKPYCQLQSINQ